MTSFINPLSSTFFRDYYTNFLQRPELLEKILLVGKSDGSLGADSKDSWRITRFLRRLLFGVSYDLPTHIKKLQELVALKLQTAKGTEQKDANQVAEELVFVSKTCRSLKGIVKRVKDRKPQLREAENDLRTKQYESLRQAAEILKISPRMLCCQKGLFSHALTFIEAPCDLSDVKEHFPALLHEAIRKGKVEKSKLLIQQGAKLEHVSKEDQLIFAMQTADQVNACKLIASDAKLSISVFKRPILHYACEKNFIDVVRALLIKGTDPDKPDSSGTIALHYATSRENIPLMQALLEYSANVNKPDSKNVTPLHIAAKAAKPELLEMLLLYGAKTNFADNFGNTALHFACQNQDLKSVTLLIARQADVNARNRLKETPLHFACDGGTVELVKSLLNKGAELNAQTADDSTPLHRASSRASIECIQYLLSLGADLSIEDRNGNTALRIPLDARYVISDQEKKRLYLALFGHSKIARDWIERNSPNFSMIRFLTSQAVKIAKEPNPYEIPFLLQDRNLIKSMLQGTNETEFRKQYEILKSKYPKHNIEFIEYAPYEITQAHYTKGKLNARVPRPERDISLHRLVEHFDNINTNDPSQAYFLDLQKVAQDAGTADKERLRTNLHAMIAKVNNRTAFLGTPREGSEALQDFYQNIENGLKNTLLTLAELKGKDPAAFREKERQVVSEMLGMMNHCGGRYFSVSVRCYLTHCKGLTLTFEDDLLQSLAEYREVLMQATIPNGANNVHDYNNLVRAIGRKYGLPGYQVFETFEDPFSHVDVTHAERQFKKGYTVKSIVKEWLHGTFADGTFREKYIDWHKANLAKNWNRERYQQIGAKVRLMQKNNAPHKDIVSYLSENEIILNGASKDYEQAILEDQAYGYLAACVMDENSGQLKESAIFTMLVQTGVLRSLFSS